MTRFVPQPGRRYEVRRALIAQGVDSRWQGRVAKLGEWQARHGVGVPRNAPQGPTGGYRDYATPPGSGAPGLGGALRSRPSARRVRQPGVDRQPVAAVGARGK